MENKFRDFLFASLANIALPKLDLHLKERIFSSLSNICFSKSKRLLRREANMKMTVSL